MRLRITVSTGLLLLLALVARAKLPIASFGEQQTKQLSVFTSRAGTHVTRRRELSSPALQSPEDALNTAVIRTARPTRGSFIADWQNVNDATGYRLDVSTTKSFASYLNGYRDLDVRSASCFTVSRLNPGTTYYYRVRAYNAFGTSADSEVMSATTASGAGLVINPTFDVSILSDPNSVAIQVMIN